MAMIPDFFVKGIVGATFAWFRNVLRRKHSYFELFLSQRFDWI